MKIVRDRGDARWLPSRFNFALFRLFAYVKFLSSRPEPRPGLMLSLDRYQSALENYTVCAFIVAVVTAYFAAFLHPVLALLAAIFALQAGIVLSRFAARIAVPPDAVTIRADSFIIMTPIVAASFYFAPQHSAAGYVARGFLAIAVLNAIASAIMFLLRGRVAALEAKFV